MARAPKPRTYIGRLTPEPAIFVQVGPKGKPHRIGDPKWKVAWGNISLDASTTAYVILNDALGGDGHRASALMNRFKHRVVKDWKPEGFRISQEDVLSVVAAIEQAARDTALSRTMAAQEPAPVGFEGGRDVVWDSTPEIKRNPPPQPKEKAS